MRTPTFVGAFPWTCGVRSCEQFRARTFVREFLGQISRFARTSHNRKHNSQLLSPIFRWILRLLSRLSVYVTVKTPSAQKLQNFDMENLVIESSGLTFIALLSLAKTPGKPT